MAAICEIDFVNNPLKIVYAGQWLCGTVRLTLTKEKNVSGVYIDFHGTAHCQYSEARGNVLTTYTSKAKYLNERICLVGGDQNGKLLLSPGSYNYTFQFELPPNIPTSFAGKFGYILYTAKVVVDYVVVPRRRTFQFVLPPYIPTSFKGKFGCIRYTAKAVVDYLVVPRRRNKEFLVPFTVIQAINLNDYPQLKEPVIVERRHTLIHCFPFCSSNILRIVASTPIGGYKPGQIINLEINVESDRFQSVSKFSVKLMKQVTHVTIHGEDRVLETITVIKQKTDRGCDTARKEGIRVDMEVPQILPSDSTSDIFKVRYFIRIIGSVGIFHHNPVLDLPITILYESNI